MAPNSKTANLSTETIITVVLAIIPLLLALLTMESGYSFWEKLLFVVVGGISVWFLIWRWEHSTKWSPFLKIAISSICSMVFFALMNPPLVSQFNKQFDIKLDFKAAPEFTRWRQIRTRYDLSRFRDHLRDAGLEPPEEIAPLEVGGGAWANQQGVYTPPDKPFQWTIKVGKNEIGSREAVTAAYMTYVFSRLGSSGKETLMQQLMRSEVQWTVTSYINASYWNDLNLPLAKGFGFWSVRDKFGQDFADRLAIRTIAIASFDSELSTDNIASFLCNSAKEADASIDSDSARWPQIAQMMQCKNSN